MSKIADNIRKIYLRRRAAALALCEQYAARAMQLFNDQQKNEEFWENQIFQAKDSVFAESISEKNFIGFFLAHGKEYGVYLELKDDRKHEALRPIVSVLSKQFLEDLRKIFE